MVLVVFETDGRLWQLIAQVVLFFGIHHYVISRLWKQLLPSHAVVGPINVRPTVTSQWRKGGPQDPQRGMALDASGAPLSVLFCPEVQGQNKCYGVRRGHNAFYKGGRLDSIYVTVTTSTEHGYIAVVAKRNRRVPSTCVPLQLQQQLVG